MATVASAHGAKPVGYLGGRVYNGATREYKILSGYATAIGEGDFVRVGGAGDSTAEGYLVKDTGTSTLTPIGIFMGCSYTDPNTGTVVHKNYYPGSVVASDITAKVADDPFLLFEMQSDGAIDQAELGQNSAAVQGTPNAQSGMSTNTIANATTTTNTLPLRVVDFVRRPGSTPGDTYTDVICMFNFGTHASLVATSR